MSTPGWQSSDWYQGDAALRYGCLLVVYDRTSSSLLGANEDFPISHSRLPLGSERIRNRFRSCTHTDIRTPKHSYAYRQGRHWADYGGQVHLAFARGRYIERGRGSSCCSRAQQVRGEKQPHENILWLFLWLSTIESVIQFAEWTIVVLVANLFRH